MPAPLRLGRKDPLRRRHLCLKAGKPSTYSSLEKVTVTNFRLLFQSRIAQWDGQSRKYYFVQLSTRVSQWEVPTTPALTVPTPGATPQQHTNPYQQPPEMKTTAMASDGSGMMRNADGTAGEYSGDRGLMVRVLLCCGTLGILANRDRISRRTSSLEVGDRIIGPLVVWVV